MSETGERPRREPTPKRTDEVTVWAVRLGRETDGRKGKLRLEGPDLAFDAEKDAHSRRIPLSSIKRVRSTMGSPVLMVDYRDGAGASAATAFFFSQPPPLATGRAQPEPPSTALEPPPILFSSQGGGPVKRRRARFTGMASLMGWNRLKKGEVRAWRDRIRAAVREAGGRG